LAFPIVDAHAKLAVGDRVTFEDWFGVSGFVANIGTTSLAFATVPIGE